MLLNYVRYEIIKIYFIAENTIFEVAWCQKRLLTNTKYSKSGIPQGN